MKLIIMSLVAGGGVARVYVLTNNGEPMLKAGTLVAAARH